MVVYKSLAPLAELLWEQEAAGSNPVTPIFREIKPFGEHVEGLSHSGNDVFTLRPARLSSRAGSRLVWLREWYKPLRQIAGWAELC